MARAMVELYAGRGKKIDGPAGRLFKSPHEPHVSAKAPIGDRQDLRHPSYKHQFTQ